MNSSFEINNCREIIPYAQENQRVDSSEWVLLPSSVSRHPRENVSGTSNESELTPHQLTGRKRELINAEVIALTNVSFAIVPLAGETNIYIVKLNKVYYHMKKRSICRSVMDVCRYILDGYEKMEVEVDSQTNMIKEIKKKETSNSEHTTTKQKENNGELHVGNEVALMCEMIELKETSEFVVR
ncbi:hypothetical protein H5410_057173 [Solanum commersonii]|uniref:Uncharacterized protein n=1 Tax=Solanum commersonii TaxID=4109 RepID=A0A9J5WPC2_SOLCO|nr:hypothetical protein H5410_057173 [Solanum commersonii]